jgi:hypothetical protein
VNDYIENKLAKKIRNAYEALKQLRDHLAKAMPGDLARAKAKEVDGAMAILSQWCEQIEYKEDGQRSTGAAVIGPGK